MNVGTNNRFMIGQVSEIIRLAWVEAVVVEVMCRSQRSLVGSMHRERPLSRRLKIR